LSLVGTQLVAAPPYLWGKSVGLINIGGLLGAFLGCVSSYAFKHLGSVTNSTTGLHLLPS
jgi:succinate-acetate transporter protein